MKSKWFKLKNRAISLRKSGSSIKHVEKVLGIPRSTLSGWFRGVELTKVQRNRLYQSWKNALFLARGKAALWHNAEKEKRLLEAKRQAEETLEKIPFKQKEIIDLALASLYLGEGFKNNLTGIGNSDPLILKFFITVIRKNYSMPLSKIKCELHLRADQNPTKMKNFWSKELGIPKANIMSISRDKRTAGSPTYPNYKGVCIVRCGHVAIQRKLLYLSRAFYEKVISMGA